MSLLNELKLFCEPEQLNTIIHHGRTIVKLTKDNIGKCSIIYGCYRFYGVDESDFFFSLFCPVLACQLSALTSSF